MTDEQTEEQQPIKQESPVQQEGAAPADHRSGRDQTRKVVMVMGAVLVAALVLAFVMGTGTGSKEADPQAATTVATQATTGVKATAATAPPAAAPTASSPHEMAGALRRDATIACRSAQWDRCRTDLEQSAHLDPEGDKVAQVQRLHRMAEQRGD